MRALFALCVWFPVFKLGSANELRFSCLMFNVQIKALMLMLTPSIRGTVKCEVRFAHKCNTRTAKTKTTTSFAQFWSLILQRLQEFSRTRRRRGTWGGRDLSFSRTVKPLLFIFIRGVGGLKEHKNSGSLLCADKQLQSQETSEEWDAKTS